MSEELRENTESRNMTADLAERNEPSTQIQPAPVKALAPENPEAPKKEKKRKNGGLFYVVIAALVLISAGLFVLGSTRGSAAVREAFEREKAAAEENTYQAFYDTSYNAAENDYHVKNQAVITLSGIRETAELEVLSVSDIVYITKDAKNIFDTRSWLQVPGTGVFTLDLAAGEFLVDNERRSVYVRLPKPDLSTDNITIDHTNVKVLNLDSSAIASSVRDGEQLAQQQLNEALTQIREDIKSNLEYYEYAEESARSLLETWIRSVNKDVEDLTVEIEFY